MAVKGIVILALLVTAVALAGCGASHSNSSAQQQTQQTSDPQSTIADVSACLMKSDVAHLITNVTLEPDPLDNNNSNVLRIETTLAPGQYEGDESAMAVLGDASECGSEELHIAIAIIDRNGTDMGE